ncbi:helix-turn-helix transcriptional regulator [Diaphorobacter sp. HDW4A]|uniref:helix-turn-helix transcriptional regulator n=1 Tax=Diaphorobacter sp. HDW4A TaxID=2714924 RepID=UPI001409EB2D|nr:helix-turn-helix transcriptional regulator [Diaphorobacter sp. HDW4A]QIL79318.1 helix-turn-helix transcriptional regulator [Diaphorobacter sp. HDW4A]
MACTKKDHVMPHLLRAQTALRHERDAYLDRLLDEAIRHRAATIASGPPRTSTPPIDKRIMKAVEYIHANLGDQRMNVAGIAAAAHVSRFHLTRIFGAAMGLPPAAYVRQRRLELAKELLAHRQEISIVNVALKSGFGSQCHLSTTFKKAYGVPPAKFRKNSAQQQR